MADLYGSNRPELDSPALDGFTVTPSDANDVEYTTRALWVGGAGAVSVEFKSGTVATFAGVPAGTILPIRVNKVRATGTTASNIIGLW